MTALYVTSMERSTGKTAICAGLGRHLLNGGKKVGFLKLTAGSPSSGAVDGDAAFMKKILALEEPESDLCLAVGETNRIKEACAKVSRGKDVVIIEGVADREIVKALDAKVVIVEGYSKESPGEKLAGACRDFGESLLGVVLNKVPQKRLECVRSEILDRFGKAGLGVLGVLPEDRALSAPTVAELAGNIQGEILNCTEQSVELVENLMLGAMTVDAGPEYYVRKANKAVIVKSDRPDMQIAALETSTRCLVLAGNTAPIPLVLRQAEEKRVPIILARDNSGAIVSKIEDALDKTRFNQEKKLPRLLAIMEQYFDFRAVDKGLGLTK